MSTTDNGHDAEERSTDRHEAGGNLETPVIGIKKNRMRSHSYPVSNDLVVRDSGTTTQPQASCMSYVKSGKDRKCIAECVAKEAVDEDKSKSQLVPSVGKFHFETGFQRDKWIEEQTKEIGLEDEQQKRNCLVRAFTENCKPIVENIRWSENYLPDILIQMNCLQDEEYMCVKNTNVGGMNQMRCLIGLLLNKDYRTMLVFLSFILEFYPHIGERINNAYARILADGHGTEKKCTICILRQRVSITLLIDELFSKRLIDLNYYSNASQSGIFGGCQKSLWEKLSKQVCSVGNYEETASVVAEVLDNGGSQSDIVQMLQRDRSSLQSSFQCRCGPQMNILKHVEVDDGESNINCKQDVCVGDWEPLSELAYHGGGTGFDVPFVEPPYPDNSLVWPENQSQDLEPESEAFNSNAYDFDCQLEQCSTSKTHNHPFSRHNTGGED